MAATEGDFLASLEKLYLNVVLEMIFTRWHGHQLNQLLDQNTAGLASDADILGFVSTLREGTVNPKFYGAGGTLWGFITVEMRDLVTKKWGREQGAEMFQKLFGFIFTPEPLLERGKLNVEMLTLWMNQLENALEVVEQTIFLTASRPIEQYLLKCRSINSEQISSVESILGDKSSGTLPNGRIVNQEILKELRWKDEAYTAALERLYYFRQSLAFLVLSSETD